MIIEVRPASALRRYRARIAGAVAGLAIVAASLFSVVELSAPSPQQVPHSDPVQR